MKNKKILTISIVVSILVIVLLSGTIAGWIWESDSKTKVTFTLEKNRFSCSADGGGDITSQEKKLIPTSCTDSERAIKREIKVISTLSNTVTSINLNLWLNVDQIDPALANSNNFRYALTTSSNSCETGVVTEGNFKNNSGGDVIRLLANKRYNNTLTDVYYLWIWLDSVETNPDTAGKNFSFSLGGNCTDNSNVQPETPVLDSGMIPVKISDDGIVKTVSEIDNTWYNYEESQWANVVLVNDSSRSKYKNTTNVTVSNNDILAHYVWIPRYKYKISSVTCGDIEGITEEEYPECYGYTMSENDEKRLRSFIEYVVSLEYEFDDDGLYDGMTESEIVDTCLENVLNKGYCHDNPKDLDWMINEIGSVGSDGENVGYISYSTTLFPDNVTSGHMFDIVFENKSTGRATGDAVNTYYTHPAFWWDNDNDNIVDSKEMLAGIWVGKFETTGSAGSPTIKPNVKALYNQNVADQFNTAKKFSTSGNIYGISNTGTNAHMMKNSEWGAVAYFTHSKYGIGMNEVQKNNNNSSITGCAGAWNTTYEDCESTYYSGDNTQSTTHNISGIYDMSGGIYEYVMGNYNNVIGNSGFTKMPDRKYYDLYTTTSLITNCTLEECGGHALYETAGWNDDSQNGLSAGSSWYLRGGYYDDAHNAGIFAAANGSGINALDRGFRSVIINGFGE